MSERLLKIEIVIPVYNRCDTTLLGLKSLSRIDKSGLDVHILIIDDGSTDGTSDAVRLNFPDVQIIQGDGTLHYAAGTNRGISAALERSPDFIITANDDAVFHDQFLQSLIKTANVNPHTIVGSMLLLWNEPHKVFQVDFKWRTFLGGWIQPQNLTAFDFPREPFEVEGLAGNCVLFPVESIRECGLMDEKTFPHGWGDIQFVVRMRKMGWKLLVDPKALVWCEPNTYPKPLHQLPISEIFRTLFNNQRHPLNLKRQFLSRWDSAPNKVKAITAFTFYLFSLFGKIFKISSKMKTQT